MKQAISINTMDEYMDDLVTRYGFSYAEKNNGVILTAPKELGAEYIKTVQTSDDIDIGIIDLNLACPIVSYYEDYANTCEAAYCFSGYISYSETGVAKANLSKNTLGIYALPIAAA